MSRNGSGVYSLPVSTWNPAIDGVSATAPDWQNLANDIAAALTQSLSSDGQTPITGNLPMTGNKLTGLGAGSATGDSVRWEQLFSQGTPQNLASAATTDIGAQNSVFLNITGTTTITSFGTNYNGPRYIRFDSALTLTHNATTLILPGAANITTAAGDSAIVLPSGSPANGWRVAGYQKADGSPLAIPNGFVTYEKLGSNVTPILTGRNKIINGAIKVDQRNAGGSQTFTAGAALSYCVDRWYGYCTGANITGQRIALSNAQNRFRFTGAASNTGVGFGQRIEAVNSMDLAGGTATLNVKLSSSSLTSITWTAFHANTTDEFGTLASPTRTQIATGTFTINSTEATYSTNISIPSAATTGIEIVFTGGALLATQTLTIGDAQLEVGSVVTPFEHRLYGMELALCQRYYEKAAAAQYISYTSGNVSQILTGMWAVQKRASPSMSLDGSIAVQTLINVSAVLGTVGWTAGVTGTGASGAVHSATIIGSCEL